MINATYPAIGTCPLTRRVVPKISPASPIGIKTYRIYNAAA